MSRPQAAAISATAAANVSSRGPVNSYTLPMWVSAVSAATATSAMSSASTNGSRLTARQRNDAAAHVVEHVVLAEVLREPRRAQHRQRRAGVSDGLLRDLGRGLAPAGQQHESGRVSLD